MTGRVMVRTRGQAVGWTSFLVVRQVGLIEGVGVDNRTEYVRCVWERQGQKKTPRGIGVERSCLPIKWIMGLSFLQGSKGENGGQEGSYAQGRGQENESL